MNAENVMFDHIRSIKTNIINNQVGRGHILAGRFFDICAKFRGFNAPGFALQENQDLLNDLLNFEKEICSFEFLYAFYGYIGRMYLQTSDVEKAIMYGKAALELNTKIKDYEGVGAANNLLCDCAIAHDAALIGVEFFRKAQPHLTDQISYLEQMPNHNAEKIQKILDRKRRPNTYKFFESKGSQDTEERVRFLMVAQGYSRATAKKYVNAHQL
jgi:tetratricopeptide (TPR) repeat protein